MESKKNIDDCKRRWNIHGEDDFQGEFQKFKNRIINIYRYADQKASDQGASHFCDTLGIRSGSPNSLNISNILKKEGNHKRFYLIVEVLLNIPGYSFGHNIFYQYRQKVFQAIELSNIDVAIAEENGRAILYPAGEFLLDKKLVNKPLSFLPESSAQHFIDALQYYKASQHYTSAESTRRCLEEFLKFKLENSRMLANNIKDLPKVLKDMDSSSEVRNIIVQVFDYLEKYFNGNSKHNSSVSPEENEFLIYQAGLLMRYVEQVL